MDESLPWRLSQKEGAARAGDRLRLCGAEFAHVISAAGLAAPASAQVHQQCLAGRARLSDHDGGHRGISPPGAQAYQLRPQRTPIQSKALYHHRLALSRHRGQPERLRRGRGQKFADHGLPGHRPQGRGGAGVPARGPGGGPASGIQHRPVAHEQHGREDQCLKPRPGGHRRGHLRQRV